jgi:hypothetical protein
VKHLRLSLTALLLLAAVLVATCKGEEEEYAEPEAFSFVIYPGSRYLGELTEKTKQAHKVANPKVEPPPTAIYDADATVEQVADYYAKQYGYGEVAATPPAAGAAEPRAYYRTGDLAKDNQALAGLLPQLGLQTDLSKAVGTYRGAFVSPRPNRPQVTIQRPYFDVTTSKVVDRTLILMSR